MKTATILHGICDEDEYFRMDFPSPSNAHWLPWLQQKFLRHGVLCQNPEMPNPYRPVYRDWNEVFDRIKLESQSIVVGHSAGAGFILRWLAGHTDQSLSRLVLVAPWLDPTRRMSNFLDFQLDPCIQERMVIDMLVADNDTPDILSSVEKISSVYPKARLHRFTGLGHFCFSDLKGAAFPALWDICNGKPTV